MPCLLVRLPDRLVVGRSGAPNATFRRRRLRAVRIVQSNLSREGDYAQAAARHWRDPEPRTRAQGGGAISLHTLRHAVRYEELDRARCRQACRQALDVSGEGPAERYVEDVWRVPGDSRDRS